MTCLKVCPGQRLIRELERLLLAFEVLGDVKDDDDPHRLAFETAFGRYVDFYLEHMKIEEVEILPLARSSLGVSSGPPSAPNRG